MIKAETLPLNDKKEGLIGRILICCLLFIGIGLINSLWTHLDYKPWYNELKKPIFAPPFSAMVGVIWTIMYITMGISIGILWQIIKKSTSIQKVRKAKKGIQLFAVQLIVNMIVPIFFFALNNLYLLLAAVLINFILVVILIVKFNKINKLSAYILLPFLIWLVYAVTLDGALLWLNS